MPAIMESIFDILYLVFAITAGVVLMRRGGKLAFLLGLTSLVLGCGDAFCAARGRIVPSA